MSLADVGEDDGGAVAVANLRGHVEGLVEEAESADEVALILEDGSEVVEGGDDADQIADLAANQE